MLTASIVTHKTPPEQLRKAIECLLRSNPKWIYIIDNSPTDSLRNELPSPRDLRIVYVHVSNRGFGAAHNMAIKDVLESAAKESATKESAKETAHESGHDTAHNDEDFHLVMNADVCWEGDVLKPLTDYLKANPDVGMVMPKVFYPDGDLQYTCRMLPTPLDLFAKRFLPPFLTKKRMERYLLAAHDHDKPLNSPYLLGSFLLFRCDALRQCGIFDEQFFMYPEDIDITRRIHHHWRTMYWPGVSIIHEHAAASRKDKKMLKIHISNMILYFKKWGWLFDAERRKFNRRLLREISPLPPSERPPGRG